MKAITFCVFLPFLMAGCNNEEWTDVLRSSRDFATAAIGLKIQVEAHEAFGEEEAHTHVSVEPYGYGGDGYYYNLELSDEDELSVTVDGETAAMVGVPQPSAWYELLVRYGVEIPGNAPGTELLVNLSRADDSASQGVLLPELTPFDVTPTADLSLDQDLLVEWVETEGERYALSFIYQCDVINHARIEYVVHYPNTLAPELRSPFTFHPDAFYAPKSDLEVVRCELTTRLRTFFKDERPADSDFRDLNVSVLRSQSVTQDLILTE